jgi:hypothetical protein
MNRSQFASFEDASTSSSMRMRKSLLPIPIRLDRGNDTDFYCVEIPQAEKEHESRIYNQIRQLSNFASFLCILDCTLLPLVTFLIPLLGFLKLGGHQLEWIHQMGHSIALLFVLPVGSLSTLLNYPSHRQPWIVALAAVGLVSVAMANTHSLPVIGHINFFHSFHHGMLHRVVNMSGCALLLTSNYLSHRHSKSKNCCILHRPGQTRLRPTHHDIV